MKLLLVMLVVFLSVVQAKENKFSLSTALVGMNMDYREYDDNNVIQDSEKSTLNTGLMLGVDLNFAYKKLLDGRNYAKLSAGFRVISGETEYVGSLLNSNKGYGSYVGTTKNIVFDSDVNYRFSHVFNGGFTLSYGIGVGYRSWRRELSVTQIEVYKWLSIRPQVGVIYAISIFSVGLDVEYQYGLNPQMTILSTSENPDTTVNLGAANILQISLPFKVSLNKNIDLFTEYTYENQIIKKSNMANYLVYDKYGQLVNGEILEPRSEAYNQYIKFGAIFKF